MSTTVDQRVVEMRFDNKQFEQNVQTSLSTIDKLKRSLNLEGAAKGLENVNSAAQKCNMTPLTNAVETVRVKFSALEVMAVTTLTNITNSAVNAGKRIVSALTIDPVKSGFEEYETQINAIQTIMSNTRSKGTTLDQVNAALDELNHYADMTIYNFTEMTRNIGTFTAAGVDLDTSVSAIKGIANLAAVSGSTSQQASTAMYQLSQALAAGTVKLQDWNSVVNAGMGGQVFQDALKETAKVHGIAIDQMIKDEGSFRETLSKGWLSTEILTETLSKFTGDLTEAQIISMGYTKEQAADIIAMGKDANDAATKVKTFSQLFDTLKEAAQSGWTQSWQLIVGDFEKAKERLTNLSDTFSKIIGDSANRRNQVLTGAFSSNFDIFTDKLKAAGIETDTFQNKVKELAKNHNVDLDAMIEKEGSFEKAVKKAFKDGTLDKSILKDALKSLVGNLTDATKSTEEMASSMEKYGDVVNKVIKGDFGNGEERIKALTEAGYDWATIQNLVNERLGSTVRHVSALTEEQLKNADSLSALSDEQLKSKGYTDEQISALRELQKEAATAGSSIDDLISAIDKPSGAELIWESLTNVIDSVTDSLAAVKQAWNDIFHAGMTEDEILQERSEKIYNLIKAINEFTKRLQVTNEKADKIRRTFKGLFAIIDIITTITGGALKLAFKGISAILNAFGFDVLDVTANIGDMLVQFRDFLFSNERVNNALKTGAKALKNACAEIKKWIDAFLKLPEVQRVITRFNDAFSNTFEKFREYFDGGIERITAFIERVKAMDGITLDDIDDIFRDFKDNVLDYFLDIDGIFDDVSKAIGEFKDDVKKHFSDVGKNVDDLKNKIFEFVGAIKEKFSAHIGLGEILTIGIGGGLIVFVKKIGDALDTLAGPFGDLEKILSNFGKLLGSCSKAVNSFALKTKSQALLNVAISIGILAASIVALTMVDQTKLWSAVGALGALAAGLLGVSTAMGILGKLGSGSKGSGSMLGMAVALLLLVKTLKSMEGLDEDKLNQNLKVLGIIAAGLAVVAGVLGKFSPKLSKGSLALFAIAGSLKIMVGVLEDLDDLELQNLGRSIKLLLGAMVGLVAVSLACKNIKIGSAVGILAIAVALKVFVGVFEDIATLDTSKMSSNMDTLLIILGSFAGLMIASKFAGANAAKAGVGILAMSGALLLVTASLKILCGMDIGELNTATKAISKIMLVFAAVVAVSQFAGANATKAGAMLLLMSGAILILSGAIVILSNVPSEGLDQALKAITTLEILFAGLIAVSSLAKDCKSTLTLIAVTIGVLAVALGALSMINPENLKAATTALSTVMAMLALVVASTSLAKNATGTLTVITGVVIVLAGILYLLSDLPVDSVLNVATGLSVLLLSLSASMLIISKAGSVAPGTYVTLGVMTLVVAGLAAIIGVLAYMNVGSVLEIATGLSVLLLSLSASCLILSAVGGTAPAAFVGIGALITLIATVGTLMAGIGALTSYFPELEEFLDKGLGILEKIGYGLGSFFGNIVGGFAAGATSGLPEIGDNLSAFMENGQAFFDGIKGIDESSTKGVKALAETILILTATDILQGIASWLTGGSSLASFAQELVPFGVALSMYSVAIMGLKSDAVEKSAIAGKALAEMAATIPNSGGVLGFFAGENNMDEFGAQLVPFGAAMKAFADEVDGLDAEVVANAATAGKAMAEMAATIPNSGGVVGFFAGENNMDEFGAQLVPFGRAMKRYSLAVTGLDADVVQNSVTVGKALMELASTVPNTGGVVSWFTGDNDLDTFGMKLVLFGLAMRMYSLAVTGLDPDVVINSANAAKALVELANNLPNTGGIVSWFTGDNDIASFGKALSSFGECFADYYDSVSNVNVSKLSGVVGEFGKLVDLANNVSGVDTSGMSNFAKSLKTLGNSGVDEFIAAFTDANSKVTKAATTMVTNFADAANGKKESLTKIFKTMVDAVVKAFTSKYSEFTTVGKNVMTKFINGAKGKKTDSTNAFQSCASSCVSALRNKYNDFYNAGVYLVTGFGNGITAQTWYASAKSKEMANAAAEAARKALDEHSPSKVGYEIGEYFGMGFVNSLVDYTDKSYEAATSIAASAKEGLRNAVSKIGEMMDSGINSQPTIRPVLDLSDIEAKRPKLNALFSQSRAISISSGINVAQGRILQNGEESSYKGNSYNFTQNNYSPKALSRVEIYRQTKNQFSAMERMVEA